MLGSLSEFRQMAQVSAQISHDHMATAFHFLISNRGAELELPVVVAAVAAASGYHPQLKKGTEPNATTAGGNHD